MICKTTYLYSKFIVKDIDPGEKRRGFSQHKATIHPSVRHKDSTSAHLEMVSNKTTAVRQMWWSQKSIFASEKYKVENKECWLLSPLMSLILDL